ncbi:NAD(+) synthase [Lagierella sp.]|uniref:NAD(+) synthase n=1 Tax=Lagierella sp. TaxID=2849657 RepID=UPI0026124B1D|nr:NAD(+) synthase [Lagierella sp.]
MNFKKLESDLSNWIEEYVSSAGSKGVVYGLSGGLDSSVVGVLSNRIFKENSLGIIMPIESKGKDYQDAYTLRDLFDLNTLEIDLSKPYNSLKSLYIPSTNNLAYSNIKPRLRMTTLYYHAQINNYLVIGTTNLSEYTIGYSTKYGDYGVDFSPIADITKSEIFEFAKYLGIPDSIINKKPSAGLWEGQNDEDELGFTYAQLDRYILEGTGTPELVEKINRLKNKNRHKKEMPIVYKFNRGDY